MFLFKKIFSRFFFPIPLCLEILLLGLLLLWFTRKQKTGKTLATLAGVLLFLFGSSFFSNALLTPLEGRYPPLFVTPGAPVPAGLKAVKYVVVLGCGFAPVASLPLEAQFDDGSIARLVEGVRVNRLLSGSKLIVSGGPEPDGSPLMAEAMAQFAQGLGASRQEMILDGQSRDTEEEALHIAPIVGEQPFVLVTEASHMPRAMALFRKQGTHPTADPVSFRTSPGVESGPGDVFPSASGLNGSERAVYEYLGLAWEKIRGKI